VAVDAAVHHQRRGGDGGEQHRQREPLGMQRDLEGAGHVEDVDAIARHVQALHLLEEGVACLVDDVGMPLRLDEGDALAARCVRRGDGGKGKVVDLTHGVPLRKQVS